MIGKKSSFKKLTALIVSVMMVVALAAGVTGTQESVSAGTQEAPKYVFYFIGDGLGAAQRQVSEFFKQELEGDTSVRLLMNTFPVAGINTTYSSDTLVTDSAAAGTALACGYKTNNGVISMLPDGTRVKSLIEAAEEKGMATGIVSTTRLTHATPAVFASHNMSRNNENEIAAEFVDSGVEFIAGGGNRHFAPKHWARGKSKRTDYRNLILEFRLKGYKTYVSETHSADFKALDVQDKMKVFAAFTYSHLPYEIDRMQTETTPSIAEITDKAIDVLEEYEEEGFFLMVEGGRIDHACHANDPAGTVYDTIAFDDALKKAYDFYLENPDETLIVVVGDHETGGMGLGFAKNYFLNLDELLGVKVSVADVLSYSSDAYTAGMDRDAYIDYLIDVLSLENMTAEERADIEAAMDLIDSGIVSDAAYGGYNQVAIAATHAVSERANVQWTTYAHSATQIPMSAIGVGAENFGGYKDNTEVANAMAALMGFELGAID